MAGRALVVQHLAPEGPAALGRALRDAGCEVVVVRTDLGEAVPERADALAALVVMGGPMSAGSDDGFPSRRAELALLRDALARRVPVLGVCLGAQLLAVAAGGAVRRLPEPEVGWGEVALHPAAASDELLGGLGERLPVLHWHGEAAQLPDGAELLASTEACGVQAFRIGPAAWGLQPHVEVDGDAVAAFVDAFGDEAERAAGGAAAITAAAPAQLAGLAPVQAAVLGRFARLAAGRGA